MRSTTIPDMELRRARFASLCEAQAVWRVLHGEPLDSVSENLDIPTDRLDMWCRRIVKGLPAGSPPHTWTKPIPLAG
ncbi:MAG: hypothetical protein MUE60_01170 [Candidatus Eisenbacteria bacterium]|jgi:hypothetical protein|nr:hypothetical protein [Candidatus Eisenbacteria bacterium]